VAKVTIDGFLEKELKNHLSKMKAMKNGNLHKMVIGLVDKSLVELVLQETSGNQTQASQILGITRNTLRKKVQEYKIKLPKAS